MIGTSFLSKISSYRGEICPAHISEYFVHILRIFCNFSGKTHQNIRLRMNIFGPLKILDPSKDQNFSKKNLKSCLKGS